MPFNLFEKEKDSQNSVKLKSFERQLTAIIENEDITKLASLCYQVGDSFTQKLVLQTLLGKEQAQLLEQLLTQLTDDFLALLLLQDAEKNTLKRHEQQYQPLKRTLTFHGSRHYVNTMMAIYERNAWAQYYQTTEHQGSNVLSKQAQKTLTSRLKHSTRSLISVALYRCDNQKKQRQLLITELDIFSAFRWLLIEEQMGIKKFNMLLNPTLKKLNNLLSTHELEDDVQQRRENHQLTLFSLLTLLRTSLIQLQTLNNRQYYCNDVDTEIAYKNNNNDRKIVANDVLNTRALDEQLGLNLLRNHALQRNCMGLLEEHREAQHYKSINDKYRLKAYKTISVQDALYNDLFE